MAIKPPVRGSVEILQVVKHQRGELTAAVTALGHAERLNSALMAELRDSRSSLEASLALCAALTATVKAQAAQIRELQKASFTMPRDQPGSDRR